MSDHGFAFFVDHPRRIEDLMCPHPVEPVREYVVVNTIRLAKIDYENFITDLVADRQFLEDNAALCSKSDVIRCLKITRRGSAESILVVPNRAWVDIAALNHDND